MEVHVLDTIRQQKHKKQWMVTTIEGLVLYIPFDMIRYSFKGFWAGVDVFLTYNRNTHQVTHLARIEISSSYKRKWLQGFMKDLGSRYRTETLRNVERTFKEMTSERTLNTSVAHESYRLYEKMVRLKDIEHVESESVEKLWEFIMKRLEGILKCYESVNIYKLLCDEVGTFKASNEKCPKIVEVLTESVLGKFASSMKSYINFRKDPYREYRHELKYLDAFAVIFKLGDEEIKEGTCRYLLEKEKEDPGHTCLPLSYMYDCIKRDSYFLDLIRSIADLRNLIKMSESMTIYHDEYVYLTYVSIQEDIIAESINRILEYPKSMWIEDKRLLGQINEYEIATERPLDPKQKKAVIKLFQEANTCLVTGGPGTGKSTVYKCIEYICNRSNIKIGKAAPTGKAARRIKGDTIHKLLKMNKGMEFDYNIERKLPYEVLVLDEISMLDVSLGSSLFQAINDATKVLILGDPNQLPSVGAGKVLMSLIQSKRIPRIHLTKCYRNGGNIKGLSEKIEAEETDISDVIGGDVEIHWIEDEISDEAGTNEVVKVYKNYMKCNPEIDEISEVQILCPSRMSLDRLNNGLEEESKNHKVMCIKNDTDGEYSNGDIGESMGEGKGYYEIMLRNEEGEKLLKIPKDEIEKAYGVTVHKSQGSEYKTVFIYLHRSHGRLLNKKLLYTGVTRAKEKVFIVSSRASLAKAITTRGISRISKLDKKLNGEMME